MKKLLFLIFLISFAFFTSVLNAKELRAALIPLDENMQNFADLILAESTGKKLPLSFLEREKLIGIIGAILCMFFIDNRLVGKLLPLCISA